jgi:hypothetical protein
LRLASDDLRGIRAKTFGRGSDGKGASGGKDACISPIPCEEFAGDIGREVSAARPVIVVELILSLDAKEKGFTHVV